MTDTPVRLTIEDEVYDFLLTQPSTEQILAFTVSAELEDRYLQLGARNNQGTITPEELEELRRFVRVDEMMTDLRLRALQKLAGRA